MLLNKEVNKTTVGAESFTVVLTLIYFYKKEEYIMINTVIFDIGMVLARFRWKEYLEEFNWTKEIKERVAKATVLSATWNQFDKGVMTWQELYDAFCFNDEEVEEEIALFFENLGNIVRMYEDSVEWVKSVVDQVDVVKQCLIFGLAPLVDRIHVFDVRTEILVGKTAKLFDKVL